MPQPVTDTSIMTVEVAEANFYKLPAKAQECFRYYARVLPSNRRDTFRFELASYRWAEIMAHIPPGLCHDAYTQPGSHVDKKV